MTYKFSKYSLAFNRPVNTSSCKLCMQRLFDASMHTQLARPLKTPGSSMHTCESTYARICVWLMGDALRLVYVYGAAKGNISLDLKHA